MDKNQTGIEFMKEGKWEEAAQAFMEAIEAHPADPVAYINFGNVLTAVGDIERALNFYNKAISLDENATAAYYSKGGLYYDEQNFEEAKNMFELAMKKGLETGDNFFMLGMSLAQMGNSRLALPYLQRSTELLENDAEAHFQYGLCLAREGFIDEAVISLEQAVTLDSQHADALYNLGVAYGFKEDGEKALEMFNRALEIQPDHLLAGHGKKLIEGQDLQ
ncbi:tetratricopeptide repeat protein [Mesobacillus subterraneus]|uniref:tetratricopeptide repeat protein n=1 Tax=Mesobacillus subterraneus TaxID=285983 RepID=UPI00203D1E4D|nr:tetratricopeptide repeat protein [Mesobacillus subterraneus]MCM3663890.1 tetratricopeptide repeat protein [Mesobacillus subterraneus]MCM3683650.1 tetratricopeptide repeat protein [Mesobacillus subterraneus]